MRISKGNKFILAIVLVSMMFASRGIVWKIRSIFITPPIYQTLHYQDETYNVLMGRNGNLNLIRDYSTLPKELQAYAYPTFDASIIVQDICNYAESQGVHVAECEKDAKKEWKTILFFTYPGDGVYNENYTEADGVLAEKTGFLEAVEAFLRDAKIKDNEVYICVYNFSDSSYRCNMEKQEGFYNKENTQDYVIFLANQ